MDIEKHLQHITDRVRRYAAAELEAAGVDEKWQWVLVLENCVVDEIRLQCEEEGDGQSDSNVTEDNVHRLRLAGVDFNSEADRIIAALADGRPTHSDQVSR